MFFFVTGCCTRQSYQYLAATAATTRTTPASARSFRFITIASLGGFYLCLGRVPVAVDDRLPRPVARFLLDLKSGPSFGSMTPSEAGRLGAQRKREKRSAAALAAADPPSPPSNAEIERNLRVIAMGEGAPAVAAASQLEKLGVFKPSQHVGDQALLALLTPEQRKCIEAHLRDEFVSEDLALRAWCGVET
jgi:hypothetical protein